MKLEIDSSLKAHLYDLYFKEACNQEGWAYARPETIIVGKSRLLEENTISFCNETGAVDVTIMKQMVPEIARFCETELTFDYLACKTGKGQSKKIVACPDGLCWMLIKRGNALF